MNLAERYPNYSCYPPVPNWYSINVTAVIEPQFFVYATRNYIVVLDLNDFKYFNSFIGSSDKIQAIAAHEVFCFTGGADKVVRIWNIIHGTLITSHKEHTDAITVMKCIRKGNVVISGDKSGKLVVAESFGTKRTFSTKVKAEITCISTVEYQNKDYVAIGYANGMIFVESIDDDLEMATVHQLTNENDAIQSMDWQKKTDSSDEWPLLATSTKRRKTVFIWSLPSETIHSTLKLPNPPPQATEQQKSSVWVTVSWSPSIPFKIYITSYIGLIVPFDVSNAGRPKICNSERFDKHSRNVFTIDWLDQGKYFISTSIDKQVIKWAIKKSRRLQTIKAQSAFPYSMDIPNWNPGQIAIGMGDNTLKIWNFSDKNSIINSAAPHDYYSATLLWKGLQGKIEKIRCHPNNEGIVAFGNEYGYVGIYETINQRPKPFRVYHKCQGAPSIAWGLDMSLILEKVDMTDTLLSCGHDGIIHVYNTNKPQASPILLNDILDQQNESWALTLRAKSKVHRCCLGIDEKGEFIAFGHTDGVIEVYQLHTLKLIYISDCQRQKITAIEWKRTNDKIWLASACENGDIVVHCISDINIDAITDTPIPQSQAFCTLKGHKKRINDIKWSFHADKTIIASASDDKFVIVWDIETKEAIALFDRHRSKVLTVCWERMELDTVFSGAEDRFIYHWNHKNFPCKTDDIESHSTLWDREIYQLNSNKNKRKPEASSTVSTPTLESNKKKKTEVPAVSDNLPGLKVTLDLQNSTSRLKKEHYCMAIAKTILREDEVEHARKTLLDRLDERQKQDPNLLKYSIIQTDQESIYDLLFGDKNDARRLIGIEVDALYEKEQSEESQLNYSLKNDLTDDESVKLALNIMRNQVSELSNYETPITKSHLMDWVTLALSPLDGKEAWLKKMKNQAEKMDKLKQYHLAATCYIACSCIYEAIDVYRRQEMYREAISLAKLRLPSVDPIISTLFSEWAAVLQKREQDQLAATCFLLSKVEGSIGNTINLLARSGKESGLFWAGCLAIAVNDATSDSRTKQWLDKINERTTISE